VKFWPFKRPVVPEDGRIALGNFNLAAQLPNQRNITVAGYIYSDDDKGALDARLDLYQECIERQRLRCEIPELEAKREQMVKGMEQAREVLADLETRQQHGEKLTSQDQMTIKNMRVNIGKVREEIEKGSAAIVEARRKAGVR
jgi:hypothetical protein